MLTELEPCAFCQAHLTGPTRAGYFIHPKTWCVLSEHEVSRDEIEAWNRRTAPDREAVIPSDAAIAACALMIKGICMTRPQESWVADIESRIRYMLRVSDPRLDALDRLAENARELGLGYEPLKAEPYEWRDTGPLETGEPQ